MPKNLVICCDGTGNIWDNDYDTNVVKLTRVLVKNGNQVLFYDPGVGTSNIYPSIGWWNRIKAYSNELVGLAFGGGVYENIGEAYGFLVEHYQPGDRLFFFGFSRGAFTVRSVAGMVNLFGIVRRGTEAMIPTLTRIYFQPVEQKSKAGKTRKDYAEDIRRVFALEGHDARVYFLGVWDTVCTVGGLPFTKKNITSSASIEGKRYDHVRHAVALDEYREAYVPRLYRDRNLNYDDGASSIRQLWFTGAHSDIGGSYKEEGLSNCSLKWMLDEAMAKGLRCDPAKVAAIKADPLGLAHDQVYRLPLWALTGLHTRLLPPAAVLHDSVEYRRKAGAAERNSWSPWYQNLWAVGSFAAVLLVTWLMLWMRSYACQGTECQELSRMLLQAIISRGDVTSLFSRLNLDWAKAWYVTDVLFVPAYAMAICVVLLYLRKALAERTAAPRLHRIAYWAGLIPVWILIGSDILENVLSLWLLYHPTMACTEGPWLCWLLAGFTIVKYLSLVAITVIFSAWGLYCFSGLKRELVNATQAGLGKTKAAKG